MSPFWRSCLAPCLVARGLRILSEWVGAANVWRFTYIRKVCMLGGLRTGGRGGKIMASSKIVKYTSEELEEKRRRGESKTDWERVRKMKDEEIDYTDSPELDDSFFQRA